MEQLLHQLAPGKSKTLRVLLIEDDLEDAEYVFLTLSPHDTFDIKVSHAQSLEEAQKLMSPAIDIILLDLSLPGSRGIETFEKVSEFSDKTPILVITGLNDEQTASETLRRGAQDFIVKGQFNRNSLLKAIRFAIERNKLRIDLTNLTQKLNTANQQLDRLAHNDHLTGLLNRRGLEQALSREIAWSQRNGGSVMVLLIDLDDFKRINDTLGHAAGDNVLKEIARRMQGPLRITDFSARIGGDEFLILLPDTEPAEGVRIAEKVRKAICDELFVVGSTRLTVTVSVGAIPIPEGTTSIDDLLIETHHALYQSKRSGKNKVSFGGDVAPLNGSAPGPLQTLIKEKSLRVMLQPIMNLENNQPMGYEFLCQSLVPSCEKPEDFFRMAQDTNVVSQIDQLCLASCIEVAETIPPKLQRHINIATTTLSEFSIPTLIDLFRDAHQGETYCLEINQHQVVGDPSYLIRPLELLKQEEFLIALENVSFGQNSLETVILLEPDYLKISQHYITGISKDPARLRSLNRFLKVAESLGTAVIAVGIESQEDMNVLKSMGVKFGQGFHWGKPFLNFP